MQDIIVSYLDARKEDFLQAKINSKLRGKKNEYDEEARLKVRSENQLEADAKYNLEVWLDNIIRKVKPNVTTHPAKFTNAKIDTDTSQIFLGHYANDGYIKTGNVNLKNKVDVSGNSATNTMVYELYDLLDQEIGENQKVIHRFEENDASLIELVEKLNADFEYVKSKCLKVYYGENSIAETHSSTRQVYFPIANNEYHLLSVKTASMLMYEVKNRIDDMNVWIDGKHARTIKKENKFLEDGFSEIFDITEIGFSNGDFIKMGNYSLLNVKNKGIAYLLSSCPPTFEKRQVRLPSSDFFKQCLYWKKFSTEFESLKKYIVEINNIHTRKKIKRLLRQMVGDILFIAFCIRKNKKAWSKKENYQSLALEQKIWLDDAYLEQRESENEWKDEIARRIAKWVLDNFDEYCGSKLISSAEILALKSIVIEALDEDKEFF